MLAAFLFNLMQIRNQKHLVKVLKVYFYHTHISITNNGIECTLGNLDV